MKKVLTILLLQSFAIAGLHSQSFTVDDLLALPSIPSKNIERFMNKNGYVQSGNSIHGDTSKSRFIEKVKGKKKDMVSKSSIDIYSIEHSKYVCFQTSSLNDYADGQKKLIKKGFFYDDKEDLAQEDSVLFQKRNIKVTGTVAEKDNVKAYTFLLEEKEIPADIKYAEELLQFNSHEYLVSFFGEQNVKKDMYYFSETELQKCSVLFSGSSRQAVFVWGNENNLNELSYILISNVLPTASARKYTGVIGNNEWEFHNGVHPGMPIKDLLKLNEMDFEIYGNGSDLAFMAKPAESGKINFKKTAIMLSCDNCNTNKMFNQPIVSALDIAKQNIPMYVYDVIIYPPVR